MIPSLLCLHIQVEQVCQVKTNTEARVVWLIHVKAMDSMRIY